jgi:hypothetical protein
MSRETVSLQDLLVRPVLLHIVRHFLKQIVLLLGLGLDALERLDRISMLKSINLKCRLEHVQGRAKVLLQFR